MAWESMPAAGLAAMLGLLATTAGESAPDRPLTHPTPEEIEAGLTRWQARHPGLLRVETRGTTAEGRPILLCRITDGGVPDDDKQVALFTTCHAGGELNSCTGLLRFIKWLLGDDPLAAAIRARQIVLAMPCCDPDGYARSRVGNTQGGNPYGCWDLDGVVSPEKNPEGVAILGVTEEYQPEVHVDVHGVWNDNQTMWESTGVSWFSGLSRSFLPEIPLLMDRAAEEAGFLITHGEASAGQVRTTSPVPGADHHFYVRHANVNDCVYSYHRYHTLAFPMEAGFEESILVRLRRLLEIGNETWRGEFYPGYPVNQVGCWTSMALAAYGTTAAERRVSRVELWRKLSQLRYGCAHPEPRGTMMAYCATTPDGARYLAEPPLTAMLAELDEDPRFDTVAIADFLERTTARNALPSEAFAPIDAEPLRHGLAIRLLIPYPDATITDLRLDGHPLAESPRDGYQLRRHPGTIVQVNIPPEKVREFHVVTCDYEPGIERRSGFRPEDWEE